jgi:hypothetical protein
MGYDLHARNKKLEIYHLSAFTPFFEFFNYLYPCIHHGGRYFFVTGVDERFPIGMKYPSILCNSGFKVTAEEARIMARFIHNMLEIQSVVTKEHEWPIKINKERVLDPYLKNFPEWAEKSNGFRIY